MDAEKEESKEPQRDWFDDRVVKNAMGSLKQSIEAALSQFRETVKETTEQIINEKWLIQHIDRIMSEESLPAQTDSQTTASSNPSESNTPSTSDIQNQDVHTNDTGREPSSDEFHPDDDEEETFNIWVGNLALLTNELELMQAFSTFGEVVLTRIFRDIETGTSRGFGFVHFKTRAAMEQALNGNITLRGSQCKISQSSQKKSLLFVGNLPYAMSSDQVKKALDDIMEPEKIKITQFELKTGPPPDHRSRGFAFVGFSSHSQAETARKILREKPVGNNIARTQWAENRTNANAQVDDDIMQRVKTVYVSDIPASISDTTLRSFFIEFGVILHCNLVRHANSRESRGFAFIEFAEREAAERALSMNGKEIVDGLSIRVELAKPSNKREGGVRPGGPKVWDGRGAGGRPGMPQTIMPPHKRMKFEEKPFYNAPVPPQMMAPPVMMNHGMYNYGMMTPNYNQPLPHLTPPVLAPVPPRIPNFQMNGVGNAGAPPQLYPGYYNGR